MKRKSRLGTVVVAKAESVKEEKPKKAEYKEVVKPRTINLIEGIDLVFSVSKNKSEEDSLPHVDIRTYIESENYTGPTKKGINFSLEHLDEVIKILKDIESEMRYTTGKEK